MFTVRYERTQFCRFTLCLDSESAKLATLVDMMGGIDTATKGVSFRPEEPLIFPAFDRIY